LCITYRYSKSCENYEKRPKFSIDGGVTGFSGEMIIGIQFFSSSFFCLSTLCLIADEVGVTGWLCPVSRRKACGGRATERNTEGQRFAADAPRHVNVDFKTLPSDSQLFAVTGRKVDNFM